MIFCFIVAHLNFFTILTQMLQISYSERSARLWNRTHIQCPSPKFAGLAGNGSLESAYVDSIADAYKDFFEVTGKAVKAIAEGTSVNKV